jgi:hypothetical protein
MKHNKPGPRWMFCTAQNLDLGSNGQENYDSIVMLPDQGKNLIIKANG